ncbi:MAG: uncharacterized protein QOG09_14 [Solirubrobacterales bacterium]|nr:uncharacterized protein [Solirubrobacterales bacterium]MDX6661912.1 uncharacterized protein [Solirubrobacterales bacterium]
MSAVLAALMGAGGGVVAGVLGVGGGIVFVPALTIFMHQSQLGAESTSLLAIVPVAALGAWRQHRYGNVRLREGLTVGLLSPVGVGAGVVVANTVPQRALELGFAALALFIAAQLVRRAFAEESSSAGGV